jgi:signal transduction histidine kinase
LHPDERDEVDNHFQTAIKQRQEVDILCRISTSTDTYTYYTITGHAVTRNGTDNCMVGIMMDITERKKLEEETTQLKHDQQKRLAMAMINGQENASKIISDALHDGVSQLLYGIKMKLATLSQQPINSEILTGVNDMLNMAITETRNISFELAPSILTDFGLPATLEELAKRLSGPGMKIKTCISGYSDRLDLSLETGIFRIIQELINNCMKHSGASQVLVEIKKAGSISIMVKDNGIGFAIPDGEEGKPHGAGLSSIRNRVNLYNGSMHIDTGPVKGTIVHIQLPHVA